MATKVYVEVAGCNRRQLDVESIRRYLTTNGFELVDDPAEADRILVTTCAFKKEEEEQSVRRLRALRKYPGEILIYGCLPDIAGERYPEFDSIPFVAPREIETIDRHFEGITVPYAEVPEANVIAQRAPILKRAKRRIEGGAIPWDEILHVVQSRGAPGSRGIYAKQEKPFFLFVCRGCQGACSYCAIRRSIGHVRSKPVDQILAEFRQGLDEGYRTFGILGDDPGCYGVDISESLPSLIEQLFAASDAYESDKDAAPIRFQIREIHPKFLVRHYREMLDLPGFSRVENLLCPVQSGSDRVIQLMERQHTSAELLETIQAVRQRYPGVTMDTQMIVGFPTETSAELQETLDFVKAGGFHSVVVFPYHDKVGTASSELDGKVPPDEIRNRMRHAFSFFRHEGIAAYYHCP